MTSIRLTPAIERRLDRERGTQPRHGLCVICGDDWSECPHTRMQTTQLEQALRIKRTLGLDR